MRVRFDKLEGQILGIATALKIKIPAEERQNLMMRSAEVLDDTLAVAEQLREEVFHRFEVVEVMIQRLRLLAVEAAYTQSGPAFMQKVEEEVELVLARIRAP